MVKNLEVGGQNSGSKLFDLIEAYILNLGPIQSLEPYKKFSVGGGWVVGESTVNLAFCFAPKLWFWTWTKLNNISPNQSCPSFLNK